jgi:PPOX class probable F420-dependent enzyme
MASLNDARVQELLSGPDCTVLSTINEDGSILSVVVWISLEDGVLAVNGAEGRRWPANLDRNPQISAVVYPGDNPYEYVTVNGTASRAGDGDDDAHIDRLARLYTGAETFGGRAPGQVRIKYVIDPAQVRHQTQ